jgi:hypothetical protein
MKTAIGMGLGYGFDDRGKGDRFPVEHDIFLFSIATLEPYPASYTVGTGAASSVVKWQKREANFHLALRLSMEEKSERSGNHQVTSNIQELFIFIFFLCPSIL